MKFKLIIFAFVLLCLWVVYSVAYPASKNESYELMSKAIDAWTLDIKKMEYEGVISWNLGVTVERWSYKEGKYTNQIDVTNVGGLVCHSKMDNKTLIIERVGCLEYPH